MTAARQPVIAILAVPETSASVLYGMYDLFRSAGRDWSMAIGGEAGPGLVQPVVVATREGSFPIVNEVHVRPETTIDRIGCPDVVVIPDLAVDPGGPFDRDRFAAEIAWLKDCHARGAVLASACSGALLFAEAGLLDGYDATTHWAFADAIARRHPRIRMRPENALVVTGEGHRLVMAGGGTSWSDLALYLISRLAGVQQAMDTARMNLVEWHAVGQQPYARLARSRQSTDAVIARCQVWIAEHYQEPAPVAAMVRLSGLPERTFKRRFQGATGLSPLEYVHTLRLEEAKQMLEAGSEPVEAIANAVGYEDAGFFGKLFRRKVGLAPVQYRRRFGAMRRSLSTA
ncbi:MAG: AraC family transcriptional regulator [Rhodanobacter sp. 68-29]|nr:helix-turn-helix domain-containing protein [Rhodanobacter sp.]ODU75214.1 MAG: AraC family transcriptional regulator [Rhodanobacter sp. SCN 69-32]OJY59587.1 MAG: AraC family transcriptional regulator [Rhodanobacter sp. 68-29]